MINRIKSCDTSKDFVFISYSKKDKDIVYPLIVKLQERGCNIWMDKELTNAVGVNWQKSALKAMASEQCKAVLFMVSRNSLVSAPVFAELAWSQNSSKVLRNNNRESLRIITINVDNEWVPSMQAFESWVYGVVAKDDSPITSSDFACMRGVGNCINKDYYEESNDTLEVKGEIAERIYEEILEKLGGSNITFANADEVKTILTNIKDTVCIEPMVESDLEETNETITDKEENDIDTITEEENDVDINTDISEVIVSDDEDSENAKKKKQFTVTGDITYTLYGKTYTENQSNMMLRIFAQVLKRHQEIVPDLCNYKGMNCVSAINYKLDENRKEMPSYFRVCEFFEYPTGSICVGTAYGFQDKCKKIALLLNICGESNDILVSEQIELPKIKTKIAPIPENNNDSIRGNSVSFTVYGESFTTNQSDMMKIISKIILEKHPEKIKKAAEETFFISLTDYRDIPKEQRPSYYRALSTYEIGGQVISVGTSFNKQAKIAEICKLIEICGENGNVVIEGEDVNCRKKEKSGSRGHIDFLD